MSITLAAVMVGMAVTYLAAYAAPPYNATEQNAGNWYGSAANIAWTDPNLKTYNGGQWVYHRTATDHQVTGYAFRFTEIGWYKDTSGLRGLIVWDSGNNRQQRYFTITAATHLYQQQYYNNNGADWYSWYVDGSYIGAGQTNFSYSTTVTCGGEVGAGVEAMGNTLCYNNQKAIKNSNGSYSLVLWGGHTNYVDDTPYYNVNYSPDPSNAFYSTGNEGP